MNNLLKKMIEEISSKKREYLAKATECSKNGDLQGYAFYSKLESEYRNIELAVERLQPASKIVSEVKANNKNIFNRASDAVSDFLKRNKSVRFESGVDTTDYYEEEKTNLVAKLAKELGVEASEILSENNKKESDEAKKQRYFEEEKAALQARLAKEGFKL